jgi:cyanophycin synthetase
MHILSPTLIEFRVDTVTARVSRQTTPFSDPVSSELADDKPLAYGLLERAGLPVPARVVVGAGDHASARAFAASTAPPFIVKPVQGAGGRGVAGQVRSPDQLRRALVNAGRFCSEVLIEQQAAGDSYRLLFLDGELLDTLRRTKPQIAGDGRSTIETLIFRESQRRVEAEGASGLKPFIVDLDCLFAIEHAGYRLDSVLPAGESVVVKSATNYNGPQESETVPEEAVRAIVEPARRAAAVLEVRLAGVDVVTTDPTRPLCETGGVILEVNAVPGLTHHYNVADPACATRIAVPILRALLEAGDDVAGASGRTRAQG